MSISKGTCRQLVTSQCSDTSIVACHGWFSDGLMHSGCLDPRHSGRDFRFNILINSINGMAPIDLITMLGHCAIVVFMEGGNELITGFICRILTHATPEGLLSMGNTIVGRGELMLIWKLLNNLRLTLGHDPGNIGHARAHIGANSTRCAHRVFIGKRCPDRHVLLE